MPGLHRWWDSRADETFWLEVTRRPDLGENLKAPQTNERGGEFWSYSLLKEVREGDVIFHYDGFGQAIVARSIVTGTYWDDELLWGARGASARAANVTPHSRPGWYVGLEHFELLPTPVTLDAIRQANDAIRSLKDALAHEVGEPIYFPLELGDRRPLRPMQGYLFKLPRAFVDLFHLDDRPSTTDQIKHVPFIGAPYREADEVTAVAARDPFAVDPALVERGVHGHAITQNHLAAHIRSAGLEPRSPIGGEPNFDLAWQKGAICYVAEVKSLTAANEEKQLRLGLGQVLRYADQLGSNAIPVLMLERCPVDSTWVSLCESLGVVVLWPACLRDRFDAMATSDAARHHGPA